MSQLYNLKKFAFENQDAITEALKQDLRKSEFEVKVTELAMFFEDVDLALDNLHKWVKPRSVRKPNYMVWAMDKIQIEPEPYGVLLIISPWNYPIQLSLVPMVGAIAAGNCILLKPSEVAPNMETLLSELLPKYLDPDCFAVVTGGVKETQELLENKFDHILYTGSTAVGKIIMEKAAKFLTPVTLELGGKSPVIVDKSADIKTAANRIAWGKLINSGQSCIAPDYLLIEEAVANEFVQCYSQSVRNMFGENPQESLSFGRIINSNHWNRISRLMEDGNIALGGEKDEKDLYIAPTVITGVTRDDPIMKEEIFGPVLPVMTWKNISEAVDYVNDNEKPLALYVFSSNQKNLDFVKQNTSSGAFTANDTMAHAACNTLPFGGVGPSGIGAYHGEHSFTAFSHMKPVLYKYPGLEFANDVRIAPFTKKKLSLLMWFVGYPTSMSPGLRFGKLLKYLSVGLVMLAVFYFFKYVKG